MSTKNAFSDIIGHTNAINQIKISIDAALKQKKSPPNFLLLGSAGVGKSTVAHCISRYLGYDLIECNAASLTDLGRLLILINSKLDIATNLFSSPNLNVPRIKPDQLRYSLMDGIKLPEITLIDEDYSRRQSIQEITYKNKQLIVFFEELHGIRKRLQNELLTLILDGTALENGRGRSVIKHIYGNGQLIFIGATTDAALLSAAMRRRFIDIILTYPSEQEKQQIIRLNLAASHISLCDNDLRQLAWACVSQSDCVKFSERLVDYYISNKNPTIDKFFDFIDVDTNGLDYVQRTCLVILKESPSPISQTTLSSKLSLSKNDYQQLVENTLLQRGLIEITPSGRKITPEGCNVVLSWQ